jgi:V/A-type H+-transporting ATPase subunit D
VARRGADVLEQKRSTLLRARLQLAAELAEAAAEWERAASVASASNARACAAAGPRALRLAALTTPPATVTVRRGSILGLAVPLSATVDAEAAPEGAAAVQLAAEAHAAALSAAARLGVLQTAHLAVEAELRITIRRLRAIEHRWIPQHETALRKLELTLEEAELADIARARWAAARRG